MLGMFGTLLWRKKKTLAQTVAEYALIVALVAIASIAVVTIFGQQLRAIFAGAAHQLAGDEVDPEDKTSGVDQQVETDIDEWNK
ncbi:MAG: Flp family type IVb pilin [Planctomycetota bacterium]